MDQTTSLLNCVAENARTSAEATEQLIKRTNDAEMRQELTFQRDQYTRIKLDAEYHLGNMGEKPHYKGPLAKTGMWAGIAMNTYADHSNSHLADIMIQGVTMGIIETTKSRNENHEASADAQGVASNFITAQQDSIERMKQFLM